MNIIMDGPAGGGGGGGGEFPSSPPPPWIRLWMDRVLGGLKWSSCLVYLDDIIIVGTSFSEHLLRRCTPKTQAGRTEVKTIEM